MNRRFLLAFTLGMLVMGVPLATYIYMLNSQLLRAQQLAGLQEQVGSLYETVAGLQEEIGHLSSLGSIRISWFDAWPTSDETKLNVTVTIINNGNVTAKDVSLVVDVLFYKLGTEAQERFNLTHEIDKLEVNESCSLEWFVDIPEEKPWHYSVDFIVYVDGVEKDHRSFGCYSSNTVESGEALEMAKQVFNETHAGEIVRIYVTKTDSFYEYDAEKDAVIEHSSNSSYRVDIYYDKILIDISIPEGTRTERYMIRYWVEVEIGKVAVDYSARNSIEFVHHFIGTTPITSKDEAIEVFFMLIDMSPGKDVWIYSVDNPLSLEVSELNDHYRVVGTFDCHIIDCMYAWTEIAYNIFKNGTATLERVKNGCGEPSF